MVPLALTVAVLLLEFVACPQLWGYQRDGSGSCRGVNMGQVYPRCQVDSSTEITRSYLGGSGGMLTFVLCKQNNGYLILTYFDLILQKNYLKTHLWFKYIYIYMWFLTYWGLSRYDSIDIIQCMVITISLPCITVMF